MEKTTVREDNELIIDIEGRDLLSMFMYGMKGLYSTRITWNELMPVVRTILTSVSGTNIGQFEIEHRYDAAYKAGVIQKNLTFVDINSVVHSVIAFIRWYNTTKG